MKGQFSLNKDKMNYCPWFFWILISMWIEMQLFSNQNLVFMNIHSLMHFLIYYVMFWTQKNSQAWQHFTTLCVFMINVLHTQANYNINIFNIVI